MRVFFRAGQIFLTFWAAQRCCGAGDTGAMALIPARHGIRAGRPDFGAEGGEARIKAVVSSALTITVEQPLANTAFWAAGFRSRGP